jgi:DNA-binding beta-propeller fold protein YncE
MKNPRVLLLPLILVLFIVQWCPPATTGAAASDLIIAPGPMKSPMRIAAIASNLFVATDYQARKVYRIDPNALDHPVLMFETKGNPLAVETVGNYLVIGNDSTGTIELYRPNGIKVRDFAASGPIQASDMVYDRQRRQLFVADSLNREIKVFDQLGSKLLRSFGTAGPLHDPKGLTLDPALQQVIVTDYGNPATGVAASIMIFGYDGRLLRRITGSFGRPQGVAVKPRHIFVADAVKGQILVFSRSSFAQTGTLGAYGVGPGELLLPMDVYFDPTTNRLLVTNNRQGKISLFSAAGF